LIKLGKNSLTDLRAKRGGDVMDIEGSQGAFTLEETFEVTFKLVEKVLVA